MLLLFLNFAQNLPFCLALYLYLIRRLLSFQSQKLYIGIQLTFKTNFLSLSFSLSAQNMQLPVYLLPLLLDLSDKHAFMHKLVCSLYLVNRRRNHIRVQLRIGQNM